MKNENVNYEELEQALREKGFTTAQVDILTNWWPEDWGWLMSASAEEIRASSGEALEN